jgi:type I restriction enzyme S subunit
MNWPPYAEYSDVGANVLPAIPNHWQTVPLKRLGTIRYGIGEPPTYAEEGTPLIRATNISSGCILTDGLVYVHPSDIPAKRIVWLRSGDIVVVRSGAYTGDSAQITDEYAGSIAGFDMVLRVEEANPAFIQYALLSGYLKQGQIDIARTRAAQPHLNAEELGSCLCILPPYDEQHTIVRFLDREVAKIDALIAKQEQLIAALRVDRTATITHAVTNGLNAGVEMQDSGVEWLGDIPSHWTALRLKNVIQSVESGTSVNAADWPAEPDEDGVLKTSCVSSGWFNSAANKTVVDVDEIARLTCPVRADSLVVNRANTPLLVGSAGYTAEDLQNIFLSDKLWQVRFHGAFARFVYYWTQTEVYRSQIAAKCVGASSSMQNLAMVDFRNIALALPPLDEQVAIVNFLSARTSKIDALMAKANEVIATLGEYRAALITDAVTGKIDVRGLVA